MSDSIKFLIIGIGEIEDTELWAGASDVDAASPVPVLGDADAD